MYKVAYNADYGGFGLSKEACTYMNEKYGTNIDPEYGYPDYAEPPIERHDPRLIEMIETLGFDKVNGYCADIRIAEIDSPMYRIDEYDGYESVQTPDSLDWVIIK